VDVHDWGAYQKKRQGSTPRPLLAEALNFIPNHNAALDLGGGGLTDAQYLLDQNLLKVDVVDITPPLNNTIQRNPRFEYHQVRFEEYRFPIDRYSLVSAQYSLPFCSPAFFNQVWSGIQASLIPEGIFAGQLFGPNDDWSAIPEMTFLNKASIQSLIAGFVEIKLVEREFTESIVRRKHWHYFDLIMKKPKSTKIPASQT